MGLLTLLRSSTAAFAPSDVSGLALWLDASASSTLTLSGSDVTNWSDRSGNANHAARASGTQGPNLVTAGQNGKDVIDYTHTNGDNMTVTAASSINNIWDGGGYVAFVARIDSAGGSNTGRYLTKEQWTIDFREPSASVVKVNFLKTWSTSNYVARSSSADITVGNYYVVEVSYNADATANDATIRINGATETLTEATSPAGTRTSDSSNNLGIGGQASGGTGLSIDGRLAEVLVYSTTPTTTEQTSIRNYLAGKWGITVS
ncbi:MAG: hypothetical protein IT567_06685 [Alphaproteobacteria bacterium]|nr:hypothetical protein [Alphaproteobacteria bacterium]